MRFSLLLLIDLALNLALAAPPDQKPDSPHRRPVAAKQQQSLTGCVDEQDGNYVLLDEHMEKLTALEAVGAGNEAFFAKHVGQKVVVKGNLSSEPKGAFKVTSIEAVSGVCTPDPEK